MIKKEARISRKTFKLLPKPYKIVRGDVFSAKFFKSPTVKFSFTISKKIDKRAVYRNKLRRQSFASLQDWLKENQENIAVHFIMNKKPETEKNITDDILNILKQI